MTEFVEYSQGLDHISERDLAQFLLRFSSLTDEVNTKRKYINLWFKDDHFSFNLFDWISNQKGNV